MTDWPGHINQVFEIRKISKEDFWKTFSINQGYDKIYKQIPEGLPQIGVDQKYVGLILFLYDGNQAIGWVENGRKEPEFFVEMYECDHEYVSEKVGNCLTEIKCQKCGHTYEIDSSG